MTDNDRPRSSLAVWLAVGVMLPVLYVFSIGPAFWLQKHGYIADSWLYLYLPLYYLYGYCPPFRDALDWYAALWGI